MKNLTLNNGQLIPIIGLGVFRMDDEKETIEHILSALEIGYRHIDTAAFYLNEEAVGKAVRESGIPRNELFITTKMWTDRQKKGEQQQAFDESMDRLNIDYIDLYLVHWPAEGLVSKTWDCMEKILESGLCKSIGVSNHRIQDLAEIKALGGTIPALNQVEIQPYFQQNELVSYCHQNDIQVEAWGPFCSGKIALFEDPTLKALAQKHGKSPAQIVLRWNVQRNVIALPKSANPTRQKQNIEVFDFALDADDMSKLASLDRDMRIGANPDSPPDLPSPHK